MKKLRLSVVLVALLAVGILAGCSQTATKSPDVSDSIRKSLDQAGFKDVTVSQDRDKGIVTLGGQVASENDKSQAESLAKSLAGAQVVADQIAVIPVGAEKEAKAVNSDLDQGIEKNLDAALIQNKLHKSVTYEVKNGVVYSSVPARQRCCDVRKVRPLERKLATLKAWATGLRRDQAETRADVPKVERGLAGPLKICPLADWSAGDVEEYIALHDVPVHPLYARGYTSIGCAPCTRAIQAGESGRAGRWWWEEDAKKECGIHFAADGSVARDILAEAEPKEMHKGFTLWFTGMTGAGKNTNSRVLELKLRQFGARVEVLDGDVVRTHLSKGLGFSKEDRDENVR